MSEADYSHVGAGPTFTIPSQSGSGLFGPYTLYQFTGSQTARVEAVSFVATIGNVLVEPVSFVVQLCDPMSNVLYQYLTPPFLDPS